METQHTPDGRGAHLLRLLERHGIALDEISGALNLAHEDVRRALHPDRWLEISLLDNVRIRREVESRLHGAGWRGESEDLWQAHRETFLNYGADDDEEWP